ncbi:serine/arginine repetitive matrix protein 2-like [Leucoraja erinacea]|uniref:serine/arginine repetitive matrix protein 2-like n=1 Tax=Leucoraja erinaceus TaxID=7782 RepID=UPI002457AF5E|nr:serine/arginine repetitive matrix protein 2-like [Leucoraja erinacea]
MESQLSLETCMQLRSGRRIAGLQRHQIPEAVGASGAGTMRGKHRRTAPQRSIWSEDEPAPALVRRSMRGKHRSTAPQRLLRWEDEPAPALVRSSMRGKRRRTAPQRLLRWEDEPAPALVTRSMRGKHRRNAPQRRLWAEAVAAAPSPQRPPRPEERPANLETSHISPHCSRSPNWPKMGPSLPQAGVGGAMEDLRPSSVPTKAYAKQVDMAPSPRKTPKALRLAAWDKAKSTGLEPQNKPEDLGLEAQAMPQTPNHKSQARPEASGLLSQDKAKASVFESQDRPRDLGLGLKSRPQASRPEFPA